jgi:hypothetical protein
MANEISKKITIGVEAQTDNFTQSIGNLNKIIDSLLAQQKQLDAAGQQNSATFNNVAAKLEIFQKRLQDVSKQAAVNTTAFNSLSQSVKQQKSNIDESKIALDGHSVSMNKGAAGAKQLQTNITQTSASLERQANAVTENKTAFDAHAVTMDHLKTSFEEIKNVSGTFGPGLKQAAEGFKVMKPAFQQVEDYAKQSAGKIATDALNVLNNSIRQQSAAKIAGLEKDRAAELSNHNITSAQKLAIQQKYKQQEAQVKAKAFKDEQEASIAQAIINGAIAITKAEAQTGVLGALVIPGIIAETAVQVAKIAAQKPPAYAKGGLHYASDGRGGVLSGYSKTDNTNAYLRSGEGIIVSEAMQVPWARNLVSAINVGFGGRDFSIANPGKGYAVGGIFTDGGDANRYYNQPVNDQKNLANTIAYQMINNFPPVYVDVKDINNQQNILAQTVNRVNL